jgi:hypothetical protein
MLRTIKTLEDANIKNKMRDIADQSLRALNSFVSDPAQQEHLHNESFRSALQGLSTGVMKYEIDPILPVFMKEFTAQTEELKGLTQKQ